MADDPPIRNYDESFSTSEDYRSTLPDIQNSAEHTIQGADVPVAQVGSSNFRLPLQIKGDAGESRTVEAGVTGTVSLKAGDKGINMSRVMRTFYSFKDEVFTLERLETVLRKFQETLGEDEAFLQIHFAYPLVKPSLRSGLEGFQFYDVAFLGRIGDNGKFRKYLQLDYIYSSTCPCSSSLVEHALDQRNAYGIPHSQRSTARVTVEISLDSVLTVEALRDHCLNALKTETQVMVRREDEQAFAELNGSFQIFVEDAVRLLFKELDADSRIIDFKAVCSHLESLHSHDAVAAVCKGVPDGFNCNGGFPDFRSLVH
uniref:Uncharacterized conserved protein n=1 Tax=uncultured verrucomicrobium HF0500_27H16 TaxID=723600 RepID=E7C5L4_9BACT|nr:uncharacterized conserved protein [uncultured verrucomicrobium HF0500_27H16]